MSKCEICLIEGWGEASSKIYSKKHKRILRVCGTCNREIREQNRELNL